jgi:excisionase family DNA binding protein
MGQFDSPAFLSEKEAAAYLAVSLSTIRRWRRNKKGPVFFRFGGILRYSRSELGAFVAANSAEIAA